MNNYIVGPGFGRQSITEDRVQLIAYAGQTEIPIHHTIGYVDIYVNGVRLSPITDFTDADEEKVVVTEAFIGGEEITAVGTVASKPYDYYTKPQIDQRITPYMVAAGSGNSMAVNPNPPINSLTDGLEIRVRVPSANTVVSPSITFSNLGIARTIAKLGGKVLIPGDFQANQEITLRYNSNSTLFEVVSLTNVSTSSVGDIKYTSIPVVPTGWIKANGGAISRTVYADLFKALVTDAGFTSKTFSVTIASPAVVTSTAHNLFSGDRIRLSSSGTLPSGLVSSTDYFVERIDANSFYITDVAGIRINTTGSQSGTHTFLQSWYGLGDGSTTFNVPDLRGEFIRGWDDGRGVDFSRTIGSWQKDEFRSHTHAFGLQLSSQPNGQAASGSPNHVNYRETGATGGVETRPRNYSMLALIKY